MNTLERVDEDFAGGLSPRWRRHEEGVGRLETDGPDGLALHCTLTDATAPQYSNAQIDDYGRQPNGQRLSRRRFPWRPPLQMTVQARFSHPADELRGTAGFGFWNDPFIMTEWRVPTLPRAVWFFHGSPPSNMKLDLKTPGHGWKAATVDALRPAVMALAPLAPLAVLLMNVPPLYRSLWAPIQRTLNVQEAQITVEMTEWHTYTLVWGAEHVDFLVDGRTALIDAPSPRGPLGFVLWMDNQYLVVTPQGSFRWGVLDVPGRQWMAVERLEIKPGV